MVESKWTSFIQILAIIMMLSKTHFTNLSLAQASHESKLSNEYSNSRGLANLAKKWNITNTGADIYNTTFRLDYVVSDLITDSMVKTTAYNIECKEGGIIVPDSDMDVKIITDDVPPGRGDLERYISVNITVDPSVESSIIFQTIEDRNGTTSTVDFCLRLGLYTDGSTPFEVKFLEMIVGLTIDFASGFSIDSFQVTPKETLTATASQEFGVDGYKCDNNNEPLSGEALDKAMSQGEVIRVCVTPNQEARDQGVYMRAIESFTYVRDYGGPVGLVTQAAVEDSKEASNFLTVLDCTPGSLVCTFETVLFASMYRSPGFVEGAGVALLQFGDNSDTWRRRSVQRLSPYRSLQGVDGVAAVSKFDLDFELILGQKFNGILKTSTSSKVEKPISFLVTGIAFSLNLFSLL